MDGVEGWGVVRWRTEKTEEESKDEEFGGEDQGTVEGDIDVG